MRRKIIAGNWKMNMTPSEAVSLIETLKPAKKRAALAGDYFILSLNIPSVLVECGFLSNAAEESLLLTSEYREKVAQGIRNGIVEYYALKESSASEQK